MPRALLSDILISGQSPYFGMFTAGVNGYTIEEVTSYCTCNGIPLRAKDIQAWQDGAFKNQLKQELFEQQLARKRKQPGSRINPTDKVGKTMLQSTATSLVRQQTTIENKDFNSFPKFPEGWQGTQRRFFPCTKDNRPMCQWGWKPGDPTTGAPAFDPNLMSRADARALSPVGWVGQNMLYQPFIVLDVDGVGHGCIDQSTIQFGNMFKKDTLTYEDPKKEGSFHLYFKTDRLIPVKHFPHAKLDLMGNAVNAAVYFKNKVSNNVPMMMMTKEIWDIIIQYQLYRKDNHHGS